MANISHLKILSKGVEYWNSWREKNPTEVPDLSNAVLTSKNMQGINFRKSTLTGSNFTDSDLDNGFLRWANLHGAILERTSLVSANLSGANLYRADFSGANLVKANLMQARLLDTCLYSADISKSKVFGVSVWKSDFSNAKQEDLTITEDGEPIITVDNIEIAQFIYLLLNNRNIRDVIDTITSKSVLILGRFTKRRKPYLDIIRKQVRNKGFLPILFDFDAPKHRDTHEMITTLARLAKIVIADITNPRSIPQELVSIVEQIPSLKIYPILCHGRRPWGMYDHIKKYPWVMGINKYRDKKQIERVVSDKILNKI